MNISRPFVGSGLNIWLLCQLRRVSARLWPHELDAPTHFTTSEIKATDVI